MNKILLPICILTFLVFHFCEAQPIIYSQTVIADSLLSPFAIQLDQGRIATVGRTWSLGNGNDFRFIILDSNNNIQLTRHYGGTGGDIAISIIKTNDRGYVLVGSTSSNDGDVTGNTFNDDGYWIVKTDSVGNLQWQRCLGGQNYESATSVIQGLNDEIVVTGYTYSDMGDVVGQHGYIDYWIIKFDSSGNLIWKKCFGGSSLEIAYSSVLDRDGGYIIAGVGGSIDGDVIGLHGSSAGDMWIIKLDTSGLIEWQKCLG